MQARALICHEARNAAPPGRRGLLDWLRGAGRRRARRASTRARSCATCATAARCSRSPSATGAPTRGGARAARRRAADGRPLARRRGLRRCSTAMPATAARCHVVVLDYGAKASIVRLLERGRRARRGRAATTPRAAEILALAPDGVLLANGPGDPGVDGRARRRGARACSTAAARSSASASATSCSAGRSGWRRSSCRSATAARTTRCSSGPPGRVLVTSQNHGFAVRAPASGDGAAIDVTHVLALRRHGRGPAAARPAGLEHAVPPRGVARAARRARRAGRVRRAARASRRARGDAADAATRRPEDDRRDRLRPDRDRPGLRVRLLRRAGAEGAARGGLPHGPRQLEPGDDHDRPGLGRPHLPRAARPRGRRPRVLRRERPDALLPDARRPDGAQPRRWSSQRVGRAGRARDRADRRLARGHPHAPRTARRSPQAMASVGLRVPRSAIVRTMRRGRAPRSRRAAAAGRDPPGVHARRPRRRLRAHASRSSTRSSRAASRESPISQVLLEESVEGWGEFELEVIRDRLDNVVIVCSIENIDPMGVHTGDSICVAPAMTLSDREYQTLRDAAAAVIRVVGVETGGSNVQFAVNRETRRDRRDRDEPARVARLGAGLEGDGLPDREGGDAARHRLHARRDPERHHAARRRPRSSRRSTTSS